MADDDEGVIKERLFLDKSNPALMHAEMTAIDNSLTRPWTVMKNYRRAPKVRWAENNCIENQAWVTIGREVYYLSARRHHHADQEEPAASRFEIFQSSEEVGRCREAACCDCSQPVVARLGSAGSVRQRHRCRRGRCRDIWAKRSRTKA
jgi:hypothetical protein